MMEEYPYNNCTSWIAHGPSKEELLESLASAAHDDKKCWVTFTLDNNAVVKARIVGLSQADEDGIRYHFTAKVDGDYRPRQGSYDTSLRGMGWIEKIGV